MITPPNIPEPTPVERAHDHVVDALAAIDRGHLRSAKRSIALAHNALETIEQFHDAKRGAA